MDEIVVKNLFRRFDEIRANPSKIRSVLFCPCETCFDMVFFGPTGIFSCNAGKFMPEEDYKMDLYRPLLNSFLSQIIKENEKQETCELSEELLIKKTDEKFFPWEKDEFI